MNVTLVEDYLLYFGYLSEGPSGCAQDLLNLRVLESESCTTRTAASSVVVMIAITLLASCRCST